MSFRKAVPEAGGGHGRDFSGQTWSCCRFYPFLTSFGNRICKLQGLWGANPYHCHGAHILCDSHCGDFGLSRAHLLWITIPAGQQVSN